MDARYHHTTHRNARARLNHGFTILELSIIILVLAFFITLATIGKDVLKTAEIRFLISEVNEIKGAVHQFQNVYDAFPGDMGDAWNQWNWGGTCNDAAGSCNGDGNEQIFWNQAASATTRHEGAQAWEHLQRSEILGGDALSGVGNALLPGDNAPSSVISSAGYVLNYTTGTANIDGNYNFLILSIGNDYRVGEVLTPDQALTVDTKMDNNNPFRGRVLAAIQMVNPENCLCNSTTSPACTPPEYNLTTQTPACNLYFRVDETQ